MISMILAISKDNSIGDDNKLLWHIPGDLKRFKNITQGKIIVMGRNTFESLPRMLPNRHHIILSRNSSYIPSKPLTSTYEIFSSFTDIINNYSHKDIVIIGGKSLYEEYINYCDRIYLTLVDKEYPLADCKVNLNLANFIIGNETEWLEENNIKYKYIDYKHK